MNATHRLAAILAGGDGARGARGNAKQRVKLILRSRTTAIPA